MRKRKEVRQVATTTDRALSREIGTHTHTHARARAHTHTRTHTHTHTVGEAGLVLCFCAGEERGDVCGDSDAMAAAMDPAVCGARSLPRATNDAARCSMTTQHTANGNEQEGGGVGVSMCKGRVRRQSSSQASKHTHTRAHTHTQTDVSCAAFLRSCSWRDGDPRGLRCSGDSGDLPFACGCNNRCM